MHLQNILSYKDYGHYTESVIKIDYLYDNLEDNKEYVLLKKSRLIKEIIVMNSNQKFT